MILRTQGGDWKMKIGIDIDNTITFTTFKANEILKEDRSFSHVSDYQKLSRPERLRFFQKHLDTLINNCPLNKEAKTVINTWHDKGNKIYFITARGMDGQLRSPYLTSLYFLKNEIFFDEIIFMQENKNDIIKKYDLDFYIDDKEKVLDGIKTSKTHLIRLAESGPSKHNLASSWQEIEVLVESWGL